MSQDRDDDAHQALAVGCEAAHSHPLDRLSHGAGEGQQRNAQEEEGQVMQARTHAWVLEDGARDGNALLLPA